MMILPRERRQAIFAVYAFCRAVDDIADDVSSSRSARIAQLDRWRADFIAAYTGREPGRVAPLQPAIMQFDLARSDFIAIIDGMAMDAQRDIRWPTSGELDLYCDRVASAVGRLCVRIFGLSADTGEELARHLGRALQLTNILRDIDEDAAIGRVYLPRDALEAAGVSITTPREVVQSDGINQACQALADRAQLHFRLARETIGRARRGHRLAPALMASVYEDKLARMMRRGWSPKARKAPLGRQSVVRSLIKAVAAL